ncbi:hypothetical protein G6M50_31250 [Agrobacterium rhizogenes]|nr:hypothetical protein [Rhizobium rhizogenes]NTJ82266.1 hypothetical protein [Rhizobium rhizogenes]
MADRIGTFLQSWRSISDLIEGLDVSIQIAQGKAVLVAGTATDIDLDLKLDVEVRKDLGRVRMPSINHCPIGG